MQYIGVGLKNEIIKSKCIHYFVVINYILRICEIFIYTFFYIPPIIHFFQILLKDDLVIINHYILRILCVKVSLSCHITFDENYFNYNLSSRKHK